MFGLVKVIDSQHVVAGMKITWGGAIKKVLSVSSKDNQIVWSLSDGTTQTLPRDIAIIIHNEKQA